ncbi:MAG TPA: hypothetical protein VN364_14060 [Bellilinea sp.]|nr:hypothetical protein [Bellilinea sp.]
MKNWIKKVPYAVIALAAVILLAVMVKLLSTPPAAASPPAGPAWVENNAQALEATLAVSTNPTEEAFIQSKLDQLRRIQATSAGSLQNVPEKPAEACDLRPTELPTPERTPGVETFTPELYEDLQGKMNSRWQGEVNGQWTAVLSGVQLTDPPQAALWVFVENTSDTAIFPAVTASGMLQIVAANGVRLTLQDAAGTKFYFDVAAREYLSSPDEVLPTLVPLPTNTPAPEICPP